MKNLVKMVLIKFSRKRNFNLFKSLVRKILATIYNNRFETNFEFISYQ